MIDFIGTVRLFAGTFTPRKFAPCDGRLMPLQTNLALYSLLSNEYGGDGRTTFGLPTLSPPAPGLQYLICIDGMYPPRD
jgi:microcystin-dependent protein